MAKDIVMPALGMAQETGTLVRWLKAPGQAVTKGEPLMEIETDKATVEIEAPADGVLASVTAQAGDVVPVGQRIALILAPGETAPPSAKDPLPMTAAAAPPPVSATPIAARMAAEHGLDLAVIPAAGGRVRKEDVQAYLAAQAAPGNGRVRASPKARRLARERGLALAGLRGSGPEGAVLAADALAAAPSDTAAASVPKATAPLTAPAPAPAVEGVSRLWAIMAERVTQAWTTIPHFYLLRDVEASGLAAWRAEAKARGLGQVTYTDLIVKVVAAALRQHPRLNASWQAGGLRYHAEVNVGLAVAVPDGLLVPVIHGADGLGLAALAERRAALLAKAQTGKLAPADLAGGTFTLSNLGMHGVDAFNAIVNPPQAAILAVGRIADRVVAVNGQPAVRPMLTLSLSCDHRAVDGARGAQFLESVAALMAAPLRLLD